MLFGGSELTSIRGSALSTFELREVAAALIVPNMAKHE